MKRGELEVLEELKQDSWLTAISKERIDNVERLDAVVNNLQNKIIDLRTKHSRHITNNEPIKPWWSID